ncbi:outer membrane beta-barrel protein [Parapedobacter sp.]
MGIRTYVLLAMLMTCSGMAVAQTATVSIGDGQRTVSSILDAIDSQSDYKVVYSNDVVDDSMAVSLPAGRYPMVRLLNRILPPHGLFYRELSGKVLVVSSHALHRPRAHEPETLGLNGFVYDQENLPIEWVSIGLYEGDRFLTGSTTDRRGHFRLRFLFEVGVSYTVKLSTLGYKPMAYALDFPDTAAFASLHMVKENYLLDEVRVDAQRPMVERRADRYIVHVAGSILENGNNGLEILQRSPNIWVDPDGAISLRGQSVMVMIDDVVQRMSATVLAEYLRTLRSEDIEKIEILPNPPAEFEAEGSGGIVHIILKKGRNDGFVGSVNAGYRQQETRPLYMTSTSLNYKFKDLYLFGSAGYSKDQSRYIATNDIHYPDNSIYNSFTDRYNNNDRALLRMGAVYDIRPNHSIGLQALLNGGKYLQYFDTDITLTKRDQALTGSANSAWTRTPELVSSTLNYSWKTDSLGSAIKFIADYLHSENPNSNLFKSQYTDPQRDATFRNSTPSTTRLYSTQLDYSQYTTNRFLFKLGAKYTATDRDNEVIHENFDATGWVVDPGRSNRFLYREQLLMGYAAMEYNVNRTNVQLGVRAEKTIMDGHSVTAGIQFHRSYLNFFPSMFILYQLDSTKHTALVLNYTRRLSRPSFTALNPYRLQFYDYLTQIGNPDLLPEYVDRIETGITFGNGISADVYFSATDNMMAQYAASIDKVIEYQIRNFDHSYMYGTSLYAPAKINDWWSMTNHLQLLAIRYRLLGIRYSNASVNISTTQLFKIKGVGETDVMAYYRSPYIDANSDKAAQFSVNLGYTKRLFHDRGRLRVYLSDIFNTAREKDVTAANGTTIYFYQKRPTRTAGISFSYTLISGKKFDNRKIEHSAEDEKQRIGN